MTHLPASKMDGAQVLHASCVAYAGRAVLILGRSGSGKSSLALRLMALGAGLVADDRTQITCEHGQILARCPETIAGMIEARGVGILNAPAHAPAPVHLVVDLDQDEADRLPPRREIRLLGQSVPLCHRVDADHFAAALLHYLAFGRKA